MISNDIELVAFKEVSKCSMARYIASNSLLKVLYLVSAGLNFFEKKEIGCHVAQTVTGNLPSELASEHLPQGRSRVTIDEGLS